MDKQSETILWQRLVAVENEAAKLREEISLVDINSSKHATLVQLNSLEARLSGTTSRLVDRVAALENAKPLSLLNRIWTKLN